MLQKDSPDKYSPSRSEEVGWCRKDGAMGLVVERGLARFSLNKSVSFDDSFCPIPKKAQFPEISIL